MRIAIYSRVSTSHQVEHQTIEQQLDRLAAHVQMPAADGWVLTRPTSSGTKGTAAPFWRAQGLIACAMP